MANFNHGQSYLNPQFNDYGASQYVAIANIVNPQLFGHVQTAQNLQVGPLQPTSSPRYIPIHQPQWQTLPQRRYENPRSVIPHLACNPVFSAPVSLSEALAARFDQMADRDERPIPDGVCPTAKISYRLGWPGYEDYHRQKNALLGNEVPTKARLAFQVAEVVRDFIKDHADRPVDHPSNTRWRVGEGRITLDRGHLTGLMQGSRSSWQPTLMVLVE